MRLPQQVQVLKNQVSQLASINEKLKFELDNAKLTGENLLKELTEANMKAAGGIADKFKVGQLEKQLSVINHITAGRLSEAIQEILTPMPVLFTMDVRFADDQSRVMAENELLAKLKKIVVDAVDGV